MRPNRRLHSEPILRATLVHRVLPAPGSDLRRSARPEGFRLRARPRGVRRAPLSRPETGARAPQGSGPSDANEAGGWRVFTTRVSASANRTTERGALSSAAPTDATHLWHPCRLLRFVDRDRTRSMIRVEGRRDRFHAPSREKTARFPDPRCLLSPGAADAHALARAAPRPSSMSRCSRE